MQLAVLNQVLRFGLENHQLQITCVLLPGSRRRQVHRVVYRPYGRLHIQLNQAAKCDGGPESATQRSRVVVSWNATCVNIGLTFSGGSTPLFKFADPPFRITYYNSTA